MATYTQLRLAVLLATCFAYLVHGAPAGLANNLQQSMPLSEEGQLMSSTNQNTENGQEAHDSTSQIVSQDLTTAVTVRQDLTTAGTVSQNLTTAATVSQNLTTAATVSQNLTTAATVSHNLTTAATVSQNLTTAATVSQNLTTAASVIQDLNTNATDGKITHSVEFSPSGESSNGTESTTVPPTLEIKLTNKTVELTDKQLDVVDEPNIILESSSFTNQVNPNSYTSDLQNTNKMMTYKSTNIMTLTTSANTEPVTEQAMKATEMLSKFPDVAQNTSVVSSVLFPIIVPDIITTSQDTVPLVRSSESHTEVPNETSYNATEFTVADDLKGTTTYILTVPMTESYKSTIAEVSLNSTITLITNNNKTIESEKDVNTDTIYKTTVLPSTGLASDDISKLTTANDTLSDTMISELLNITLPNLLIGGEDSQTTISVPEKISKASSDTNLANTETNEASKLTEISKTEPTPAYAEPMKPKNEDLLTHNNVEMNEIDRNISYLPIRKQYTAIERRKTTPVTEAAVTTHYNIATELAPKTSKKHLNVWVADLKLPDNDVDLTSIPRNPTSTMYPTLIDPTTPLLNSVVSRRAGYINNIASIEQDIDKQPSSTNPVRASNPSLTDTFPMESILDIRSTIPSYSLSTLIDHSNVITTPLTLSPNSMSTPSAPLTTTAQPSDTMLKSNLNSDSSKISQKNISELEEFIETDVLPLSPSLIQQMRLVDDAMKEEFMKEMALSLTKKLSNFNKTIPDNVYDEESTTPTTTPNVTEKSRNFTLYKVNPNYKPLKRLEIQPSKQFTIDPDDNSWRNESINSRGVVFKANNSSIVFTQVLKNKTEAELNNTKLSNKDKDKDEQPELRERLEKLAEKRKYKKKYNTSSAGTEDVEDLKTIQLLRDEERSPPTKVLGPTVATGFAPIFHKHDDVYDLNDDDDEQFTKLSNVDILKSSQKEVTTPKIAPVTYFPPNRKGTIQYFPPRNQGEQVKYSINFFATENSVPFPKVATELPTSEPKIVQPLARKSMEPYDPKWRKEVEEEREEAPPGVYMVKHFRDFIHHATGGAEDRQAVDEYPMHAEVLTKIVEDFNKNSEQLKSEFPVLYNTSVVHGGEASSRAYLRRLHEPRARDPRPGSYLEYTRRYDPACENLTVELNPAYELHYYVPDQEERQEAQPDAFDLDSMRL